MNIDESISQFRRASRELFNSYFRVSDPYAGNRGWTLAERFSHVETVLFDQLVAVPHSLRLGSYGSHQPNVHVSLEERIKVAPVMVNRDVESGYWDDPLTEISEDVQMSFLKLFDWDVLAIRDYQYVRVRIDAWGDHPEGVGKHALIEVRFVAFDRASE